MKLNRILTVACMTVCLSLASGLRLEAQETERLEGAGAGKSPNAKSNADTKFLEEAMKGGMAEVKMAELATQKAQSQSVKQFAERLNKDHTEANQKMQQLGTRAGLTQPTALDSEHQQHLDRLSAMSGAEFDKQFIKHALQDHKKDIKKFEKQAESGEDPAIRSFARETLPTLREHQKIAQALQDNPNASIPELNEPAGAAPDAQQPPEQQYQPGQPGQDTQSTTQP